MKSVFRLGCLFTSLAACFGAIEASTFSPSDVISKDVVILGGGASGAHAAVRLREDFGKSVLVVETKNRLGGHVDTYTEPGTNTPYDYGVQAYFEYRGTRDFFSRFNISLVPKAQSPVSRSTYVDFVTGKVANGYVPPNSSIINAALARYLKQAERYEDILFPGVQSFPTAEQIPAELLMPFGEFAKKYDIEAAVPQMLAVGGTWASDISTTPTIIAMQAFGPPVTRSFLNSTLFTPASHDNSELYRRIRNLLGNDVWYTSKVLSANRSTAGVELVVQQRNRSTTVIRAKRLLVSFPPTVDAMTPLGLDQKESDVFSKWISTTAFAGIVTHPALTPNQSIFNTPLAAVPSNYLARPDIPFVGSFAYVGNPGWRVLLTGDANLSSRGAQKIVQSAIDAMNTTGSSSTTDTSALVKYVAWAEHGPMKLHPSLEDIRKGFYQSQNNLQGYRSTWYTGAAWSTQFTSHVWAFTDTVLPKVVQGL